MQAFILHQSWCLVAPGRVLVALLLVLIMLEISSMSQQQLFCVMGRWDGELGLCTGGCGRSSCQVPPSGSKEGACKTEKLGGRRQKQQIGQLSALIEKLWAPLRVVSAAS